MGFKRATSLDELWSGEKIGALVDGHKVLLIHLGEEVFAYEDRCAHQAVALSEGRLEGTTLTCPAHEWRYDACTGRGINPTGVQLKRYPVRIENREVWVDVG